MKLRIKSGVLNKSFADDRKQKKHLIFRYKTRSQIVISIIKKHLNITNNFSLLDLGSAEGLTLLELNKELPKGNYLGIEYSNDIIGCQPIFPANVKIIQGDITKLHTNEKINNKLFDVITALAVLEHLPNPINLLISVKKLLKPGGIFIATCPNPFWESISVKLGLLQNEHHLNSFKKNDMINLIEKIGMKLVDFKRFMLAPTGFIPYLKVPISPILSLKIDNFVLKFKIFNWLFVNQCIIVQKV